VSGNPHVIVGDKTGAHLVNLEKPWRRIRKAADLDDIRTAADDGARCAPRPRSGDGG
jgi:hypothetical protein